MLIAFGNIASITTPIAIGCILKSTGAFNGALALVSAHVVLEMASYLSIVNEIKRAELRAA
ncbi:MAG: hypothetical protein EXS42_07020 [Lacunisphaera sp.]|nr:hypothetical protein [Lacunisphaera sp.]